jgi:hypothetical protein
MFTSLVGRNNDQFGTDKSVVDPVVEIFMLLSADVTAVKVPGVLPLTSDAVMLLHVIIPVFIAVQPIVEAPAIGNPRIVRELVAGKELQLFPAPERETLPDPSVAVVTLPSVQTTEVMPDRDEAGRKLEEIKPFESNR